MSAIFINYRRSDTKYPALRIYEEITKFVAKDNVFIDVSTLSPGADFRLAIKRHLQRCSIFLTLIGPDWLSEIDRNSNRPRIHARDDLVRMEIATALQLELSVIPILVDEATMPRPEDLPEDVQKITDLNAEYVQHRTFAFDLERLANRLGISQKQEPSSNSTRGSAAAISITVSGMNNAVVLNATNEYFDAGHFIVSGMGGQHQFAITHGQQVYVSMSGMNNAIHIPSSCRPFVRVDGSGMGNTINYY